MDHRPSVRANGYVNTGQEKRLTAYGLRGWRRDAPYHGRSSEYAQRLAGIDPRAKLRYEVLAPSRVSRKS
jgi:hypothetical protein